MSTARMVAAGFLAAAIVIPTIAPVAQAQDSTVTTTTGNPTMTEAQSEVVVKPINIGDKTISGKLLLRKGESSRKVAIRFDRRNHQETITVARETALGDDLVAFEYPIPTKYTLQDGEPITVGVPGQPKTFKQVFVGDTNAPDTQVPAPGNSPGQQPGGDNKPGQKPGNDKPGAVPQPPQNPGATPKPPQGPGSGNGGMMLGSSGSSNLFG
ncbi:hypothetical protein QPX39_03140 [Corynebacterium propinquum]|uniref:hypothetical protein n=1 Tax=Corynebacterium propinquum TaxID=43769 RepID=UPI00223AA34C|nr:hypothetical protein [Corynebacterium propinquum]MCT1817725.1 hypothetical protein [Corynebacterium propinquum]MDK4291777.1 hypothetical protein [Corynebacterium propinquum]